MMASQADSGASEPRDGSTYLDHRREFASDKAPAMLADPDALANTLGHPPTTFAQFVRKHREEFAAALR